MSDGLEDVYGKQENLARRTSYLETLEGSPVVGFDRTVTSSKAIGPDASLVVSRYVRIEAGGSLTIKAGGELKIIS